ncbi:MAG TPA: hypothetical protein VNU73_01575 [Steroidobacteraceae bacterium]|jgi:hypothetical protein|nr:hypothetical protein [Steroidobacteraceae bacterium]
MSNTMPVPAYRDDPNCRETFVETVQVGVDAMGFARVEFCVLRWEPDPPRTPRRVPVIRLVMSRPVALALRDQLVNMAQNVPPQQAAGMMSIPPGSSAQ